MNLNGIILFFLFLKVKLFEFLYDIYIGIYFFGLNNLYIRVFRIIVVISILKNIRGLNLKKFFIYKLFILLLFIFEYFVKEDLKNGIINLLVNWVKKMFIKIISVDIIIKGICFKNLNFLILFFFLLLERILFMNLV